MSDRLTDEQIDARVTTLRGIREANHDQGCDCALCVAVALADRASRSSPPEAARLWTLANWLRGQSRDALGPEARALLGEAADRVEAALRSLPAEDPRDEEYAPGETVMNLYDSARRRGYEEGRRAGIAEAAREAYSFSVMVAADLAGDAKYREAAAINSLVAQIARAIRALAFSPSPAPRAEDGGRNAEHSRHEEAVRDAQTGAGTCRTGAAQDGGTTPEAQVGNPTSAATASTDAKSTAAGSAQDPHGPGLPRRADDGGREAIRGKVIEAARAWRDAMCCAKAERAERGLKDRGTELLAAVRKLAALSAPSSGSDQGAPDHDPDPVGGKCCACGYDGATETDCRKREDRTHCEHWWDGPDEGEVCRCGRRRDEHGGPYGEGGCGPKCDAFVPSTPGSDQGAGGES